MRIAICTYTVLMLIGLHATAQSKTALKAAQKVAQAQPAAKATPDAGERAFAVNCNRCHNPPEQINPRITDTIVRHMRVRANLSAADERALQRFFNP